MTPDQERDTLAEGLHPKAGIVRPVTRAEAAGAVAEAATDDTVWCLLGRAPNDTDVFARPMWTLRSVEALIQGADRVAVVDPATPYDPPSYLAVVADGELYQFSLTAAPTYVDAT